jgi:hypothetical protein
VKWKYGCGYAPGIDWVGLADSAALGAACSQGCPADVRRRFRLESSSGTSVGAVEFDFWARQHLPTVSSWPEALRVGFGMLSGEGSVV